MADIIYPLLLIIDKKLLKWYNSTYYIYMSIWIYRYNHHSGLISIVCVSYEIFEYCVPDAGYLGWGILDNSSLLTKFIFVGHINIRGFINFNILKISALIYSYNDQVILRIVWVRCYGINTVFNIMQNFKT